MPVKKLSHVGIKSVVNTIGETQRTNNYRLVSAVLPEGLAFNITEADLPSISVDVIEIHHGNGISKQAGSKVTFGSGTLSFRDSITQNTQKILLDIFKDVFDIDTETGGYKFIVPDGVDKRAYANDWYAILSDPAGLVAEKRTWQFGNAWFSKIEFGSLSSDGSDLLSISVTLEYDYANLVDFGNISEQSF